MSRNEIDRPCPPELRFILEQVYTSEGVEVWWGSPNRLLGSVSPRSIWDTHWSDVMALAESLLGQVAT